MPYLASRLAMPAARATTIIIASFFKRSKRRRVSASVFQRPWPLLPVFLGPEMRARYVPRFLLGTGSTDHMSCASCASHSPRLRSHPLQPSTLPGIVTSYAYLRFRRAVLDAHSREHTGCSLLRRIQQPRFAPCIPGPACSEARRRLAVSGRHMLAHIPRTRPFASYAMQRSRPILVALGARS